VVDGGGLENVSGSVIPRRLYFPAQTHLKHAQDLDAHKPRRESDSHDSDETTFVQTSRPPGTRRRAGINPASVLVLLGIEIAAATKAVRHRSHFG
jgi:hypothetical protein